MEKLFSVETASLTSWLWGEVRPGEVGDLDGVKFVENSPLGV